MVQGTGSNVGKSIIVTALCRIFRQDGYRVAPFKAQNMALNSFVTAGGGEMGRAQVLQAQACGLAPQVEMNPVLLKPTGNAASQVIVLGKPVGNMSARDYHLGKNMDLLRIIGETLAKLHREYEIIVIEGAGSPAEVNLKDQGHHQHAHRPDGRGAGAAGDGHRPGRRPGRGGRARWRCWSRRRSDWCGGSSSTSSGAISRCWSRPWTFLEQRTGKPVLGVLPYLSLDLPAEDSVCLEDAGRPGPAEIEIAVVYLPRISNFTDFDPLALEPGVRVRYVKEGDRLGTPDLIIIPGTKNTTEDLLYLYETGHAAAIRQAAASGVPVCGLCGGYQMLGRELRDPEHTESARDALPGLGLLDVVTTFAADKVLAQAEGGICAAARSGAVAGGAQEVAGYEIHMGRTVLGALAQPFLEVTSRGGEPASGYDGAVAPTGSGLGHLFPRPLRQRPLPGSWLLGWLASGGEGLDELAGQGLSSQALLEQELDRLAAESRPAWI